MRYLSDQMLVEVYQRAVDLQLDNEFIQLLFEEMKRRAIATDRIVV